MQKCILFISQHTKCIQEGVMYGSYMQCACMWGLFTHIRRSCKHEHVCYVHMLAHVVNLLETGRWALANLYTLAVEEWLWCNGIICTPFVVPRTSRICVMLIPSPLLSFPEESLSTRGLCSNICTCTHMLISYQLTIVLHCTSLYSFLVVVLLRDWSY